MSRVGVLLRLVEVEFGQLEGAFNRSRDKEPRGIMHSTMHQWKRLINASAASHLDELILHQVLAHLRRIIEGGRRRRRMVLIVRIGALTEKSPVGAVVAHCPSSVVPVVSVTAAMS